MPNRALVAVAAILLLGGLAEAAREIAASAELAAKGTTIPLVLQGGLTGSTTLGANRTHADTTINDAWTLLSTTSLLSLEANSAQTVQIRFVSVTGLPRIATAVVKLAGTTQVRIDQGVLQQSTGPAVPAVPGGAVLAGGDLQIEKGQNAALTLEIVSANGRGGQVVETWILRLRG